MKAQFISIGEPSEIQQIISGHTGLAGELVHLDISINSQISLAETPAHALDLLEQAAEEHDLIFLLSHTEALPAMAQILADALEFPLVSLSPFSFPVPQGSVPLSFDQTIGFVLSEGEQSIFCLPNQSPALLGLFGYAVIPYLTEFYYPCGNLEVFPLTANQVSFAHEYAANFHEPNSFVAVYEDQLQILCLKQDKEASVALSKEIAEDFMFCLSQQKTPSVFPALQSKLNVIAPPPPPPKPKKWYQKLFPWKGDSSSELIRKSVLLISAAVFMASVSYIGIYYYRSYINDKNYSSLEEIYDENNSKPKDYPKDYQDKFAGLYAVNPEIAGWLQIDGTSIAYPVVQTDNNFDYLKKDFYGNKIPHGTPYLDYQVDLEDESSNMIIYGHNMKDGQMFAPLTEYQKLSFYKEHPVITFDNVYRNHQYKIISVFITNNRPDHGQIFPYHEFIEAENTMEMSQFLSDVLSRSLINTGVDVQTGDHLLTLSTCTYEFDDARFVVVARAVREGESTAVDTSKAAMNPAPLMPDIWYELYGGQKPQGTSPAPSTAPPPVQQEQKPEASEEPPTEAPEETQAPEKPQEEAPPQPQAPEKPSEPTPEQPEAPPQPPQQPPAPPQTPEQPQEQTPPPQEPPAPEPKPEPKPEPESKPEPEPTSKPASKPNSSSDKEEEFRCDCVGCNYISKHDCTGDVDNCPCDCGVCSTKRPPHKEPDKDKDTSDEEEDTEEEEDFSSDETLKVKIGGKTKTYDTYDLLCQIVQNEMGGTFHKEAMKAQAVAAYSYIKYNNSQGIAPSVLLRAPVNSAVKSAVKDVLGVGVYYNGKICNTTYFAASAGVTNNSQDVWNNPLPYLVSIDAEEDENNKYYGAEVTISQREMAKLIEDYLGIDPEDYGNPDEWLEDIETYDNGMYVKSIRVAGKTISGRQFREGVLRSKIYSHAFEVEYDGDDFVFTTYGYGHGVGMSQYGAQYLAQQGEDYEDILEHYYTDVTVH